MADFGIARAVEAAGGETPTQVTSTGIGVGTPLYMSPEQAVGDRALDGRSDIYSLACVLYETLAGQPPFSAASAEAILARKALEAVPSLRVVREAVPPAIEEAITRALARVPADRFTTASQFAEALAATVRPAAAVGVAVPTPRQRPWLIKSIAGTAIALLAVAAYIAVKPVDPPPVDAVPRLVVLPFENLGPAEDEYFADGITDEITARLAGLSGLAVIARQSAMQYKATDKTPEQIGRELDAQYLLEATVSWQRVAEGPSRVRIRPQLIRASDAAHLWADVLDEDLTEVFRVQTQIATRVVERLGVVLRDREGRSLAAVPTQNLEAHDLYLRGLTFSNPNKPFDDRDTRIAIGLYQRAVELDPGFALAYAAMADAHWRVYWSAVDPTADRLASAKQAVDRALALDPELVEGRFALAQYHYAQLDYDAALRQLEPLRVEQPHNAEVIALIGFVQRREGRFQDAIASLEAATRLGPRSARWFYNLGETYWLVRDYAAAERVLTLAAELPVESPNTPSSLIRTRVCATGSTEGAWNALEEAGRFGFGTHRTHQQMVNEAVWLDVLDRRPTEALQRLREASGIQDFDSQRQFVPRSQWLGEVFRLMNQQDSARTYYEAARPILEVQAREFPDDPRYHSSLGIVYAGLGRRDEAVAAARRGVDLLPISREAYRGPYAVEALAQVYTMIGDEAAALNELEQLLSIPSHLCAGWLRNDPRWDPLREHPRFRRLVEE